MAERVTLMQQFPPLHGRAVLRLALLSLAATPAAAQEANMAGGYTILGIPGMIDMPSAFGRPDAELATTVFHSKNQTRTALTFQIVPRLSGTFRYSSIQEYRSVIGGPVTGDTFDRSFSIQYRLVNEGERMPAIALGMNDMLGTGLYSGEYLVASKHFTPRFAGSLGLGWGRLGSYHGFSNPLNALSDSFDSRADGGSGMGGTLRSGQWFRGNAALFAGVEYRATDKLRLIAEYSSDAYQREDGATFEWKSPVNIGISYQPSSGSTYSAQYLYGSEIGLQWTYALNPKKSLYGSGLDAAPPPVTPRSGAVRALNWPAEQSADGPLARALLAEGLRLNAVLQEGKTLRIEIQNERYGTPAQAVGRGARVLTAHAPADVTQFDIRLSKKGMPVTSVLLPRDALETLEFHPVGSDLLRASTHIRDAKTALPPLPQRYPHLTYALSPYMRTSLFDPDDPLRLDAGVALSGRAELGHGLILSGRLRQSLLGNLDAIERTSDSVLPHVRTDSYLYEGFSGTAVTELTGAWYVRAGDDLFGRVTAGYLERGYGGLSAELLWKPQNSRLALGAELNQVRQRAFDSHFGFSPYEVTTGHLSAYYDLTDNFVGRMDVGRYLAGDEGVTLALDREFNNGWRVGAYATKTNVSATEFGEGSFDKGIHVTIPLNWVNGKPDTRSLDTVIQSLQRDGGAKLQVAGRLYNELYGLQASELDTTWGRFWK